MPARAKKLARPHLNGKKLGTVTYVCHPSYNMKCKIRLQFTPAWAKNETISKITRAKRIDQYHQKKRERERENYKVDIIVLYGSQGVMCAIIYCFRLFFSLYIEAEYFKTKILLCKVLFC
jgi:hypothetical protein